MMKEKLIFGAIDALLYPLMIWGISPFIHRYFIPKVSAAAGPSFGQLDAIIFGVIGLLIISTILAHIITRSWWIAPVALILGLFISWAGYIALEYLGYID